MMNSLPQEMVSNIIKAPEKFYKTPNEVLQDLRLNSKQKEMILDSWEYDEKALLVADDENMTEGPVHQHPAEKIQEVQKAKEKVLHAPRTPRPPRHRGMV